MNLCKVKKKNALLNKECYNCTRDTVSHKDTCKLRTILYDYLPSSIEHYDMKLSTAKVCLPCSQQTQIAHENTCLLEWQQSDTYKCITKINT